MGTKTSHSAATHPRARDAYGAADAALLVVDPFNDFLSEGGKLWPRTKKVAEAVNLLDNMRRVLAATRDRGLRTIFVPHHRTAGEGDYTGWKHLSASQKNILEHQVFARDSWGGSFHPDFEPREGEIVAAEHWGSSGFANTDLDLHLKQLELSKIVLIGMRANTCIDATARFGQELGYHVTLVRDAIAAFSEAEMEATFELNAPTYAHAILTSEELIGALG
jgi:nicotinamidase-related amidase